MANFRSASLQAARFTVSRSRVRRSWTVLGNRRRLPLLDDPRDPDAGFIEEIHRHRKKREREGVRRGDDAARRDEDGERGMAALGSQLPGGDDAEEIQHKNDQRQLEGEAEAEE